MRPVQVVITILAGSAAFAQAPASAPTAANPQPAFEVASVKPNTGGRGGLRGTPDPKQFNSINLPLRLLILRAFEVNDYQIVGPGWLQDLQGTRFDIHAKAAEGTTKEQIPLMLQNLLAERFGMKFHMEKRELPGYELVIAKGGVKMKESAPATDAPADPGPGGRVATRMDPDGKIELAPGRKGRLMMGLGGGRQRISARLQTLSDILEMCQSRTGNPVIDKTSLTGTYDFNLDFSLGGVATSTGEPSSASGSPLGDLKDDAPPFLVAIQSLGLKLQPAKVTMDVVVIDHIEKVPTEN
jgi:uncharacterized protein (TIGR03435 family)